MTLSFTEEPIINSPYEKPDRHWELKYGVPTENIVQNRRLSEHIVPVPPSQAQSTQPRMNLGVSGISTADQEYDPTPIINDIRRRVDRWRSIPDRRKWGVTPETARLLEHWRSHEHIGLRPFFCQVEAAETIIWLTEVAKVLPIGERRPDREFRGIFDHIREANKAANPELLRVALKNGHRHRENHGNGHANRLADHKRRSPAQQPAVHQRVSDHHARNHHPGPAQGPTSQRP